jgi:DNA-binding transcriptional LysR family regulator
MDLNAARMFVLVVQAGSLSAAADRSGVPLPTLSRRVRDLEHELKVQLFERSTRGVRLTEAGTRLYEYAVRGIEVLSDGEQAVRQEQARLKGRLRLSAPPAFEPWWRLLHDFQLRYPDIQLAVYSTERRVDLIQDGIDVVLRLNEVADDTLVARRIISYRHVLVATPELVAVHGAPATPEDLHRFPCGVWTSGIEARALWRLGSERFEPRPILATNDYQHLRQSVLAGEVVTELPPFLAQQAIADGRLVALLPDHKLPVQEVNLLYHSHRFLSTLVRAYLDFCLEAAPRLFSWARSDAVSPG